METLRVGSVVDHTDPTRPKTCAQIIQITQIPPSKNMYTDHVGHTDPTRQKTCTQLMQNTHIPPGETSRALSLHLFPRNFPGDRGVQVTTKGYG